MFLARWLATAILAAPCAALPASAADGSFVETFDGARLDGERWFVSDGWASGDFQTCLFRARNVALADGALVLSMVAGGGGEDRSVSCAEIQTRESFGYGLYEVRMRAAPAPGTVSAFFTYIGPVHDRTHEEVDIEFLGKDTRSVQLNFFSRGRGDNAVDVPLAVDAAEVAREYAFRWAPDAITWYVDGRPVHRIEAGEATLPEPPAKLFLSLWSGRQEAWLGRFRPGALPLRMTVDRVAFTAAGAEACPFEGSLACRADASGRDGEAGR